ncbi:hypothetical protein HAD_03615 [Hyphomonas adhaerens MHS-3]|uniref:PIN like domain-containing protein n=1 Tax=Hyphomonas adhaerens MHS-3 TaxID=1280949 RepID=A0A069E8U4_9PROT|nr:PIN-like domain-containing protein [Hyphomonas adhaerens]KCZ84736.1 hypothetical protein HAD_03615 [Hyphomonas adhaerens MHS-3]
MRDQFPSFYKFDEAGAKKVWADATFVFDANVLLNVYRYPEKVATELLDTIEKFKDRVWVPHNIALEYQRNRLKVIAAQRERIGDVRKLVDGSVTQLSREFSKLELDKRHSFIDPQAIIDVFDGAKEKALKIISQSADKQIDVNDFDPIRSRIDAIFSGRVGSPPKDQEELDSIYVEGQKRYDDLMPPGFKDAEKAEDSEGHFHFNGLHYQSAFGDYLNWHQILSYFSDVKSASLVIVTDDAKDDWWWRVRSSGNKTIGIRRELVEEFCQITGSKNVIAYASDSFLRYAKENEGAEISSDAIETVKDVARRNERRSENASNLKTALLFKRRVFELEVENAVYEYLLEKYPGAHIEFSQGRSYDFIVRNLKEATSIAVEVKTISDQTSFSKIEKALNITRGMATENNFESVELYFLCEGTQEPLTRLLSQMAEAYHDPKLNVFVSSLLNGQLFGVVHVF